MWRFYWVLVRGIPKALFNAVDLILSVSAVVLFLAAIFNRRLGERLVMSYHAVSPWWSLVPVGAILIYGMMRSNYENFLKFEAGFNQIIAELRQENAALRDKIYPPQEDRHRQLVREKIQGLTKHALGVLRFILDHGEVTLSVVYNCKLDEGTIRETLEKCTSNGLVMKHDDSGYVSLSSPLAMMTIGEKILYWINPTLRDALAFVLAEQGC